MGAELATGDLTSLCLQV